MASGKIQRTGAVNVLFFAYVLGAVRNSNSHLHMPPPRLLSSCGAPSGGFGVSTGGHACSAGRGEPPRGGVAPVASSSASSSSAASEILTLRGEAETEETIKKSRFIGRCGPAATFEEAKALLGRVLQEHPKARHSCWAWRGLGEEKRFSDDGEPGGTAGQPILGGIESEGLSEVMVVVTRYSGGIKLGTGGLCRAYGGASRQCLQAAERETRTPVVGLVVTAPVASVGSVYQAVSECRRLSEEFTEDGSVVLRVAVEVGQVEEVRRRIRDATKGAADIAEEEG